MNRSMNDTRPHCDSMQPKDSLICDVCGGKLEPNGRYIAAGNIAGGSLLDRSWGEDSTIQFWDARSGQALFSYQAPRAPGQLTWSPDSHLLAVYTPQDYGRAGMHVRFSHFALQVFEVV